MNTRHRPSRVGTLLGLLTLLRVAAAAPGSAEGECEPLLLQAEADYRAGRIEEIFETEVRETCLERAVAADHRVRALALLAKVYIAVGESSKAAAAVAALVKLDPDYQPNRLDPGELGRLLKTEKGRALIYGVSKTDEPLREAPATVVVVTAEKIERRGYLDLEQVLHDLPGFDISRGNGDVYSNLYMRGYRSDRSDRMLFIVDGVEQNDLHSNTAYISRQYPLSNIEQIEVVYGPASTIYGANAFTGVISVTTKRPVALLEEGNALSVHAQLAGGSYGTSYLDATLAGRHLNDRLSWSVTGRWYRSDEQDLSGFADWDFDVAASLDAVDYQEIMQIEGPLLQALIDADDGEFFPVLQTFCEDITGYCEVIEEGGEVVAIALTPEGETEARRRDRELFEMLGGQGRSLAFADETEDWAVDAKLRFGNLTFGIQSWRRNEGTSPWYTDIVRTGTGNDWIPKQTSIYARYTQPLGNALKLDLFLRFKQHELDGPSTVTRFLTNANGDIDLVDFALFGDAIPSLQEIVFDQKSTQIRNELTLVYEPSSRFNLVGGIELRNSSTQVEFKSSIEERIPSEGVVSYFEEQLTGTKIDRTDLGVFAQLSYKPLDDLKIVAGGRLDSSSVRDEEAFVIFQDLPAFSGEIVEPEVRRFELTDSGSVFNPRLALVYMRGDFIFKAIYAEAFKEPSNLQRFAREPGIREFSSPNLEPERVHNLELHATWQPHEDVAIDLVGYQANYSNAVTVRRTLNPNLIRDFPSVSGRFMNIGRLEIRGVQANAALKVGSFDIFGNYTYTEPLNTDPVDDLGNPIPGIDDLRIGDIASHRLNLGVNATFGENWGVDVRANYVGDRDTGGDTTVRDSPLDEIGAYFVAHATVSYEGLLRGATLQLIVNNLFDEEHYHPGVQHAGMGLASRLPQPGRAVYLRLSYKR